MDNNESTTSEVLISYMKWAFMIVVVIIVFFIIKFIYDAYNSKSKYEPILIPGPTDISQLPKPFSGNLLPMSSTGSEYAYSFWIFINDWNFNYGKPKCIFVRTSEDIGKFTTASPSVYLYPKENKLMVRVSTLNGEQPYDHVTYNPCKKNMPNTYSDVNPSHMCREAFKTTTACDIDNIPLQSWVNVSITLWNRTLDVYLNGKLARSCVLPGIPLVDPTNLSLLHVGRGNTFNGYISKLKYFNRAITASEAYDIYVNGPLPASYWYSDIMNKIQVSLNVA